MNNNETAIIAGGCFWCTEAVFRDVIGVSSVESGYIGGDMARPGLSQRMQRADRTRRSSEGRLRIPR